MDKSALFAQIQKKKSFLCIGLDTDINKIPPHLLDEEDPIFSFNKAIIDATHDLCVAYKPNMAFYESRGIDGWKSLQKTIDYIPKDVFTIADAKRGDIGNTSKMYASAFFEQMSFDSITVAPYMGRDSVTPFLEYKGKWVILLALTSNEGAKDFQLEQLQPDGPASDMVFERLLKVSQQWGTDENMMYVVGATRGEMIEKVRKLVPNHFFLVPGVGAQGGSLEEVAQYGLNDQCGLLVNSSRGIIYRSQGEDFARAARNAAEEVRLEMQRLLEASQLI